MSLPTSPELELVAQSDYITDQNRWFFESIRNAQHAASRKATLLEVKTRLDSELYANFENMAWLTQQIEEGK